MPENIEIVDNPRTLSIYDWLKLALIVLLLSIVGADLGMHSAVYLGCYEQNPTERRDRNSGISKPPTDTVPSVTTPIAAPDETRANPWCDKAIQKQQSFDEWLADLFGSLKFTDLVVAIFTGLLVWVGHQANAVSKSQRNITAAQGVILRQQTGIMDRQFQLTVNLERPLVLVVAPRMGTLDGFLDGPEGKCEVPVGFHNHGRSPAILEAAHIIVYIAEQFGERRREHGKFVIWTTAPQKSISYYTIFRWPTAVLKPGEPFDIGTTRSIKPFTLDQIEDVKSGRQKLWVDGVLMYEDAISGKTRETHFRWLYDFALKMMVIREEEAPFNRFT